MLQTAATHWHKTQWYVVHCKPLKEWQAARVLEEHFGLTVYLPEIRRRFRGQIQRTPFFPRYLFVRVNLERVPVSSINTTPGVLRLVMLGEMPQPVLPAAIEFIHRQVEELNNRGGLIEHRFAPGDSVWLKDGPFQGLQALFVGPMKPTERVWVLIDFLGSLREAQVDIDVLERTSAKATQKPLRRTRGKGRRIRNQC
jgi:transcriptional antiterminator RfaH